MMDIETKKNTGSFYTCNAVADYIAKWAIETPEMCVLEPSFGDGIFITSALLRYAELGEKKPKIIGVEVQENPFNFFMKDHPEIEGFRMDFMDFRANKEIDAIIGNPPYISLKNLEKEERKKIQILMSSYGLKMQACGSLWMPFMIHATELLQEGGKLGFVLPYEITHVRYAFDLWRYLSLNYGEVTICRVYHDFFPDVDVEAIVFLADKKGERTDGVCYKVFETITDLHNDKTCHESRILIEDIIKLKKPFERNLMPEDVIDFLDFLRAERKLAVFVDECKFKIGYVSGNKEYFHLSEEDVKKRNIRRENTRKCLINTKQLNMNKNIGVETKGINNYGYLFYPTVIDSGEKKYIQCGEEMGINKSYKCKVRNPWYLTPCVEKPDIVLTVFGDTPKMLLNNDDFYVSNSLLSGFSKLKNTKELICRWYNSLTLLSVEITIHSLGGGTLVLIPGETDRLEIISDFPEEKIESIYRKINDFAKNHSAEEVYQYGDTVVLKDIYGFSDEEIKSIRNGLAMLRNWRKPEKRKG